MQAKRATVLVCVLNWGIGHATRCIPVIEELRRQDFEVVVCSDGHALQVLKGAFRDLRFETLPGYNATYADGAAIMIKMALQLPKFIKAIQAEHKVINALVAKYEACAVISDNRYGCYSNNIRSIFITHQLNILMPPGFGLLQKVVYAFNKKQISNFNECWVPDYKGKNSLSGMLSQHTDMEPVFIGTLSRMKFAEAQPKYDVAVVLSGPEPQRSILEAKIKAQLLLLDKRSILVRGIPSDSTILKLNDKVEAVNFLNAEKLNKIILQSNIIVARSGYSSIMDLQVLGSKALFIPTPGQTEQQYLARALYDKKIALSVPQEDLNLEVHLAEAEKYKGFKRRDSEQSLLSNSIAALKQAVVC